MFDVNRPHIRHKNHHNHNKPHTNKLFHKMLRHVRGISEAGGDLKEDGLEFLNSGQTTMKAVVTESIESIYNSLEAVAIAMNSTQVLTAPDPTATSYLNLVTPIVHQVTDEATNETVSFQRLIYSIVIPLMLFFCFLSSAINLFIVLSVRWCRKPLSPTLYFSISLALADAYASSILGIGLVVNSLLPTVYGINISNCIRLALEAFRLGGVLVTVAHLLIMCINYWIGIARPLHYAATMTRRTALRLIFACWILPIFLLLVSFTSIPDQGFQSLHCQNNNFLHTQYFRIVIAVLFFAPLIVMFTLYIHMLIIVQKHIRCKLKHPNCLQLRRNVKAVITTCFILGAYIICWMPAILWFLLVCNDCVFIIKDIPMTVKVPVNISINILVILKAFIDPIIYAARMADIQAALQKMRYGFFCWFFKSCAPTNSPTRPVPEVRYVGFTRSARISSQNSNNSRTHV